MLTDIGLKSGTKASASLTIAGLCRSRTPSVHADASENQAINGSPFASRPINA